MKHLSCQKMIEDGKFKIKTDTPSTSRLLFSLVSY